MFEFLYEMLPSFSVKKVKSLSVFPEDFVPRSYKNGNALRIKDDATLVRGKVYDQVNANGGRSTWVDVTKNTSESVDLVKDELVSKGWNAETKIFDGKFISAYLIVKPK